MRVGYVVSRFPKTTETFIVREIGAVVATGDVDAVLFSIIREKAEIAQTGSDAFLDDLTAITDLRTREMSAAQLRLFRRDRATFLRMWRRAILGNWRSPKFLRRALVVAAGAPALAEAAERQGVEHLHAHWGTHSALLAYLMAMILGIEFTLTLHAHDLMVDSTMLEEKLRAAALTITISDHNRRLLSEYGPDVAERIRVLHCGIDTDAIERRPTEPANDPPRLAMVASLEPQKGHVHLLAAVEILRTRGLPVAVDLVGEGVLRPQLEELAGPDVQFHGATRVERAIELTRAADIAVLPGVVLADGRADGIPVALMEAMAAGVPVVSTRVSGIPELVVDDITGLLAEPEDPVDLADAIERMLTEPELRSRLTDAARRHVEQHFDIRAIAASLTDVFQSVSRREVAA